MSLFNEVTRGEEFLIREETQNGKNGYPARRDYTDSTDYRIASVTLLLSTPFCVTSNSTADPGWTPAGIWTFTW